MHYAEANIPGGEKEGYFFCQRGRKYRNSIRPNRVTGSGFWKATGIDKPIYSNGGEGNDCVGLKKTLVYYRGSAGKGTKTDWMMHEFRLPSNIDAKTNISNAKNDVDYAHEAVSNLHKTYQIFTNFLYYNICLQALYQFLSYFSFTFFLICTFFALK